MEGRGRGRSRSGMGCGASRSEIDEHAQRSGDAERQGPATRAAPGLAPGHPEFAIAPRTHGAGGATLLLALTTPLWVYAKSFMAEPLQGLGLLLALVGAARAGEGRWHQVAALGILIAASVKPSMMPFALLCAAPMLPAVRRS